MFKSSEIKKIKDFYNSNSLKKSMSMVSEVNKRCPNFSHQHRKSTKNEYTQNKLYNLNAFGCYLCNNKITLNSYIIPLSWKCPRFSYDFNNCLTLDQKLAFLFIATKERSQFQLPIEMILMIFEKAFWTETKHIIERITPEFIEHCVSCRLCSEHLISNNTYFTCANHIIPRKSIRHRRL